MNQQPMTSIQDGNNPERYISYADFDGTQGTVTVPLREL